MNKRTRLLVAACALTLMSVPLRANGEEGRAFVGVDVGAMLPSNSNLHRFVHIGGTIAPYFGYMFNDYIGLAGQIHAWAGKSKDTNDPATGAVNDDNTTWVGGLAGGPVLALPLGDRLSLFGTFQPGIFTGLADEAITDTSFGMSTGGGLNFHLNENLRLGLWGRWNRLYQRVHGSGDPQYVTTGIGLTYVFGGAAAPPPPPPPAPTPRAAAPPPVSKKVVPRAVYFDFNKSNIRPDAKSTLDEAVRILKSEGGQAVICEGHTDSRGTDAYNQKLSLRRANSVRDYLIKGGIPASSIKVEGFGESRPVAGNETDDGRQQNRRVELRLMGK